MAETCPFEITPLKEASQVQRPSPVNLNYTNQDFWSMKARLVDFIKQNFTGEFNDFVESSLAIMLIENWAFIADTLSFKIDQIANEIFIDTVTEIDNAFRLAKLVGFQPTPPIPSRSLWTARINSAQTIDLVIPTPFDVEVTNNDQVINIELFPADNFNRPIYDQPIVISAGNVVNSNIVGLQGQTYTETFLGNGTIDQSFLLTFSPVLLDSIRLTVDNQKWERVEFFTDSQPRKEYRVEYNANYSAFIIFGNNRAGLLPPTGSVINVVYRVGGGPSGNIVTNFANTSTLVPVEGQAFSVPVSFTNYTKGEFGYSGDTVEDIRRKLPVYVNSQNRAVTGSDYENIANLFTTPYNGAMGKAAITLRHSGCAANIIEAYILAKDGISGLTPASSQFKAEFMDYMDSKKMITDYLVIKDGVIIQTVVHLDVVMDKYYRTFEDDIKSKIERNLAIFFNLNNWDYGQGLRDSDIVKALSNIQGPYRYDITFTTNDPGNSGRVVHAKYFEIIRPENTIIQFHYE